MSALMKPYAADMKGMLMGDELMDILDSGKIRTEFQPIISLKDGSILGYEALSRGPEHSPLEKPKNKHCKKNCKK